MTTPDDEKAFETFFMDHVGPNDGSVAQNDYEALKAADKSMFLAGIQHEREKWAAERDELRSLRDDLLAQANRRRREMAKLTDENRELKKRVEELEREFANAAKDSGSLFLKYHELGQLVKDLMSGQENLPPEFSQIVHEKFWELLA